MAMLLHYFGLGSSLIYRTYNIIGCLTIPNSDLNATWAFVDAREVVLI